MKRFLAVSVFSAALSVGSLAAAQDGDPEAAVAHRPPPAHRGFQMALRTGYALPFGKVSGGDDEQKMSDYVTGQVPLFIEIGGKPIKHLFVGGYVGIAFGGTTGDQNDACDAADVDCVAVTTRIGAEVQYHILPDQDLNPWVGYGIGLESTSLAVTQGDEDGSMTNAGIEFARLSAGIDFRINRVFGVGPFADFSFGKYYSYQIDAPEFVDADGDIEDPAFHEWLTVGARFVFFP